MLAPFPLPPTQASSRADHVHTLAAALVGCERFGGLYQAAPRGRTFVSAVAEQHGELRDRRGPLEILINFSERFVGVH